MENIEIGEIEIPKDYFNYNEDQKAVVCLQILDRLLKLIDQKRLANRRNLVQVLRFLLDSSIEMNLDEENYEIVQVLQDIKDIIDEPAN